MMDPIRTIRLRWWHGTFRSLNPAIAFRAGAPAPWQPAINAYRCEAGMRICVELAGVHRSQIDLTIEGQRLLLRGQRAVPEPTHEEGRALQTLAMEIDYGPFQREVQLPSEVDVEKVHAEQRNGLLWISLPLKS